MKDRSARMKAALSALNRGLLLLTGGDVVHQVGVHFLTVAVSAYTYDMTGSAWAYALQQLVMFLPWMLLPGIAGPLVDRLDRRKVMILAGVLRGLVILGYLRCRTLDGILGLSFASSICSVFLVAARTALIPELCDRSRLLQVNGVRTAVFGCVDMITPALAGALMRRIGTSTAFRLVSAANVAGALWFLAIPSGTGLGVLGGQTAQDNIGGSESGSRGRSDSSKQEEGCRRTPVFDRFVRDMRQAVTLLRADRVLLGMILLHAVYDAGQHGANALFYPFAESVLHGGPAVFGLSVSFYFGANLLAGVLLASFGKSMRRVPIALMIVPATLAWFSYSIVRSVPIVLVLGFVEGLVMSTLSTLLLTHIQVEAPPSMTGRVWGLAMSAGSAASVTGILVAGRIAGSRGTPTAYAAMGASVLLLTLVIEIARRRVKKGC